VTLSPVRPPTPALVRASPTRSLLGVLTTAPRVVRGAAGLALAAAAAVGGVVLAAVASRLDSGLSPVLVVTLPLAALALLWSFRRPLGAAALIPASLPFGFLSLPGGLQAIQVALLLVIGIVVAHRLARGQSALPSPVGGGWLALMLGLVVLAVPGATDRAVAVNQVISALLGGLVIFALVGACESVADVRRMVTLLLVGGLVVCAWALPQASSVSATAGGVIVAGARGIFSEHNQFGAFSTTVLMLALGALLGARSWLGRLATALVALVALVAVGLALSRGAYLGTALGGLVLIVLLPRIRRAALLSGVSVVAVLSVAVALAPRGSQLALVGARLGSFTDPGANPTDDRPSIWAEALRQIRLNPWTGSGPANFPVVAAQSNSQITFGRVEHAHDVPLTVAAEVGLPAAAVLILLTLLWTRVAAHTVAQITDRRDQAVVAGVAAALAAFVAEGLLDTTLRSSYLLALLCTCTGLLLAAATAVRAGARDRARVTR